MANARMEVDAAKQKLQDFYNERAQAQSTLPQGDDSLSDGSSTTWNPERVRTTYRAETGQMFIQE